MRTRFAILFPTTAAATIAILAIVYLGSFGPSRKTPSGAIEIVKGGASPLRPAGESAAADGASVPGRQPRSVNDLVGEAMGTISPHISIRSLACQRDRCAVSGYISSPDNWEGGEGVLESVSGEYLQDQLRQRGIERQSIDLNPLGDGLVIFDMSLQITDTSIKEPA